MIDNMKSLFQQLQVLAIGCMLVSCNGLTQNTPSTVSEAAYILTVKFGLADTAQSLLSRYGGRVLSLSPEAGFAILAVSKAPSADDSSVTSLEVNRKLESTDAKLSIDQPNQITLSGAKTGMSVVGMNAWGAWSSGWGVWSSAWGAWSSGTSLPTAPSQNPDVSFMTRVSRAHAIARKFGAGVTVAVLDTGLDMTHLGLFDKLVPLNRRWDFVDNDNDPSEVVGNGYGHGTAVAGLVLQVAPKATIMPLRVLDKNGQGDLDNVITAIDFAIKNGAKVINISLGSTEYAESLRLMVQYAKQSQVYIVASAGNQKRQDEADYPARMAGWTEGQGSLFSVGSVSSNENLSSFTNRGSDVTFFAPGENLVSFAPKNRILAATGTSFAAPLVSGALALAYSEVSSVTTRANLGSYLIQSLEQQSLWWKQYKTSSPWVHSNGRLDVERFLLTLPAFSSFTPRSGALDLVVNGGFENNSLSGWTVGSNARIETDTGTGGIFSGKASLMFSSTGKIYQRLNNLQPNTTYTLKAWGRVFYTGDRATIGVRNNGSTAVARDITAVGAFEQVSMTFKTGLINTSAEIYFEKTMGNGSAAADLFMVTKN